MMKKKSLFGKTTALVISSVVLFASPASAQEFRVNNVGLPTIPGLPNMSGGIIVTPDNPDEPISLEDRIALSASKLHFPAQIESFSPVGRWGPHIVSGQRAGGHRAYP